VLLFFQARVKWSGILPDAGSNSEPQLPVSHESQGETTATLQRLCYIAVKFGREGGLNDFN
jgi:hypothetical protein